MRAFHRRQRSYARRTKLIASTAAVAAASAPSCFSSHAARRGALRFNLLYRVLSPSERLWRSGQRHTER
eukprot:2388828-Pleurochrysis_carterae.AAC.1